jgi:single-strand DNA-binding protein
MASLNKVLLIGNLTRDPELSKTQSGQSLCKAGLAVNRRFQGQNGETREETCFIDVTIWGPRAESFARFFKKGRPVFIEGRLNFRTWDDPQGQKRSKLDVVCENWSFVEPRGDGGGGGAGGGEGGYRASRPMSNAPSRVPQRQVEDAPPSQSYDDFPTESEFAPPDDTVPF